MASVAAVVTLASGLSVASTTPSHASPTYGGRIYATGGNVSVTVEMLPGSAGYTSELWLFAPGPAREIATNREVGKVVNLGRFTKGAELIFGVHVRDTGRTFKMGPGSRNGDGLVHAVVNEISAGHEVVGFEDKWGGGDWDFNDDQFEVSGGIDDQPVVKPDPRGVLDVVLLGDSYSAGNGARDASGKHNTYYGVKKCYRARTNWAEKYVKTLRDAGKAVNFHNRACSGAVLSNMLSPRNMHDSRSFRIPIQGVYTSARNSELQWRLAGLNICRPRSSDEYYNVSVEHTEPVYSGPFGTIVTGHCHRMLKAQLDAVTSNTDLVLFTIGGNDIGFSDIVMDCLAFGFRDSVACRNRIAKAYDSLNKIPEKLGKVLSTIRQRSHAKVVILGYPYLEEFDSFTVKGQICSIGTPTNGIPQTGCTPDSYRAGAAVRRLGDAGGTVQAHVVAAANKAAGKTYVTLLDNVKQVFAKHEPSAGSILGNPDRWINEILDTRIKMEWYHPNGKGHDAEAQTLERGAPGTFRTRQARLGGADVVLLVDTTRTMSSALTSVREHWGQIADAAAAGTDNVRFSLVSFRDSPQAPGAEPGDYASRVDVPFDTDPTTIQTALDGLAAGGGGDTSDAVLSGLFTAVSVPWRDGVKKIVLVVTDAPPRNPETFDAGLTASDVEAAADAVDPAIVDVVDTSGSSVDSTLEQIARHTDGDTRAVTAADAGSALVDAVKSSSDGPYAFLQDGVSGQPGQTVTFDASASFHPDGALIRYDWDFDDDGVIDASTESATVDHTYAAAYRGLASVRVTDEEDRSAIATTDVSIEKDGDDVPDAEDNCLEAYNPDQEDFDQNGLGDACESTPYYPAHERPGVSVLQWDDPDGDSTLDSVTTRLAPHFNVAGQLAAADDVDFLGLTWSGGTLQLQLAGLQSDLDVILTDQSGVPVAWSANSGNRTETIRRNLPPGNYDVVIVAKTSKRPAHDVPRLGYRVNATRIARR